MNIPELPIAKVIDGLKKSLAQSSVVLAAPPGSGKTTVVPLTLLEEQWLAGKKILILEPRRLAARAAASRMADLLGEEVGKTVGYQIRFDRNIGPATRIEVLTEGILTRRIQEDPDMADVGLIIFDEFHERSIHADLALAFCLDICQLRDDLRLLVMSATLDTEAVSRLMGGVPVITGAGKEYNVSVCYLPPRKPAGLADSVVAGIARAAEKQKNDILVFLPGRKEIREVERRLRSSSIFRNMPILPLFGDLNRAEQDRAVFGVGDEGQRIILATAIAETSLTIEGVGAVVDSGLSRRPQFDPASGLTRLVTVRVSRASARQRAGRAGRLGPGYCVRLWGREEHHGLLPFHPPEIVVSDLTGVLLDLARWGVADPGELRWLDPPRASATEQARQLLISLGAIDWDGRITDKGRVLAGMPGHPRLANILLAGRKNGKGSLAADIAAILSERDMCAGRENVSAELRLRLELLAEYRLDGATAARDAGLDPSFFRFLDTVARQWRKSIGVGEQKNDLEEAGSLLAHGYPDRLAMRRSKKDSYLLSSGKGAVLPPGDPLTACRYLAVAHLSGGSGDGRIHLAEPVDLEELEHDHADLICHERSISWSNQLQRVEAVERQRIGAVILRQQPVADPDEEAVASALLEGIVEMGADCLPWKPKTRQLQLRVDLLRRSGLFPDLPDLGDGELMADHGWLLPFISGMRSREDLQRLDIHQVLEMQIGYAALQVIDREAPQTVTVASGSRIRLTYQEDGPPILAVRIQEMFGCTDTPRICRGSMPVLVHLLSPAGRPMQMTTDLEGFWHNSYVEIKKELKGRYPKHHWPDDPLSARPTRGVKPRKKTRR